VDQVVNKAFGFSTFVLDLTRGKLRSGDADIELRPKTFEVLRHLAENAQRLVPKDELCRKVWGNVAVSDDSLIQCIRELRLKLGDDARKLIKTVSRRGYMLDMPVTVARPSAQRVDQLRQGRRLAVVVLPFQNLSGDAANEQFVDALTVDLTSGLSLYPGVIAGSASLAYKSRQIEVRQIGRELDAGYAIEGEAHRSGDSIRITARLIDALTAAILRTESFDLDQRDLERLRDDAAGRLVCTLGIELIHARGQRSLQQHPDDPDALDFVLRANALWARTQGGRDLVEVRRLFQEALKRDETVAQAWYGLAMSYLRNLRFSATRREDLEAASAAAERAMVLAPQASWSHLAAGRVHYESGRVSQALASFEHAVLLNRNDLYVHASIGAANVLLGDPEKALEHIRTSIRLSPRDLNLPVWQMHMGVALLHLGRPTEAADWLTKSTALDPGDRFTHLFLASALALAGRDQEAKAEMAELLRLRPGLTLAGFKAVEPSDAPAFLEQRQCIYEGLRRAGLPE
jgi:TolB-like protein/Flp pilus assembly protein TadD